jgi:iron complex transport system substrate-binding protein
MRSLFPAAVAAVLLTTTAASAQDFPQTFEHRFGTTVVEAAPERVVTLSYTHDTWLALGVVPVALRLWFADGPYGTFPWATPLLGDAQPVVIEGDVNIEQIAALDPDVIEAVWAGITLEEYDLLSQIAPVVAAEGQYADFGTPWDVMAVTIGRIAGQEAEARAMVDAVNAQLAEVAARHPDWAGQTATLAWASTDGPGIYRSIDTRARVVNAMGFVTPPAVDAAGPESEFYAPLSGEDLSPLDSDLLLWVVGEGEEALVRDLPLRLTLRAHAEGREVLATPDIATLLSVSSVLSLPEAIRLLEPLIAAAMDGDPATPVPTSVAAGLAP